MQSSCTSLIELHVVNKLLQQIDRNVRFFPQLERKSTKGDILDRKHQSIGETRQNLPENKHCLTN